MNSPVPAPTGGVPRQRTGSEQTGPARPPAPLLPVVAAIVAVLLLVLLSLALMPAVAMGPADPAYPQGALHTSPAARPGQTPEETPYE